MAVIHTWTTLTHISSAKLYKQSLVVNSLCLIYANMVLTVQHYSMSEKLMAFICKYGY